jgi:spermidine synthase
VSITISEEKGVRFLHLGTPWVQGAMRIARPWSLELEYTRDMMLPLLLRSPPWPASVLQIGLGAASVTKFLYRHRPEARITVVEILPEVVTAARQYFSLPEDRARIRIAIADAREFVAGVRERFDLILADGYDANGNPGKLDTANFYRDCYKALARDGIMAVNLLTRRRGVEASVERIRQAFGERVTVVDPSEAGNTVVIAVRGESASSQAELRAPAALLKIETGLNLLPVLSRFAPER